MSNFNNLIEFEINENELESDILGCLIRKHKNMPYSTIISCSDDLSIKAFSLESGKQLKTYRGHLAEVTCIKVILNSFPDVMEVDFEKVKVYLGSSFELPEEERTIEVIKIHVTFNNLKGERNWGYLWEKRKEVIDKVESYFNLDWRKYGSKWDFDFYEAKKEPLRF